MTEHVQSFMREMAEAYRALEQEPEHKQRIATLEEQRIHDGDTIARLERRIMEMKAAEDDLSAKLRSVEAERDDAGFRLLETEDKLDAIRRTLGFQDEVANAVAKAEASVRAELTPKVEVHSYGGGGEGSTTKTEPELVIQAEPEAEVVHPNVASWATSWASPAPIHSAEIGLSSEPSIASTGDASSLESVSTTDGQASAPEGDSAVDPIGSAGGSGGSEQSPMPEPHGPFHGKRYVDVPDFVRLEQWIAGGGTEEDYYWRPAGVQAHAAS